MITGSLPHTSFDITQDESEISDASVTKGSSDESEDEYVGNILCSTKEALPSKSNLQRSNVSLPSNSNNNNYQQRPTDNKELIEDDEIIDNETRLATTGEKRMSTDAIVDNEMTVKKLKSKEKKVKSVSKRAKVDVSPQQGISS